MAGRNLIKHLVTAEEIAQVVAFLASPKAIAINGDCHPRRRRHAGVDLLLSGVASGAR